MNSPPGARPAAAPDAPGGGEGRQDHYAVRVSHRVNRAITLNHRARGWRLCWELMRWYTSGSGLLAFSPAHAFAFGCSDPGLARPDLQFVFTPASYADSTGPVSRLQDEHWNAWFRMKLRPLKGAPRVEWILAFLRSVVLQNIFMYGDRTVPAIADHDALQLLATKVNLFVFPFSFSHCSLAAPPVS